jgi:hypothetical protein
VARTVNTEDGLVSIVEVDVVGIHNSAGWVHLAKSVRQFVPMFNRADSV